MNKQEALYLSWLIWEEIGRIAKKGNQQWDNINALKESAIQNLVEKGEIDNAENLLLRKNHWCPCCIYNSVQQKLEGDDGTDCVYCPALELWAGWAGYQVWDLEGGVPCEGWSNSPYSVLKHAKKTVATHWEQIDAITEGFLKLYGQEVKSCSSRKKD